jgi:hypothetical protein
MLNLAPKIQNLWLSTLDFRLNNPIYGVQDRADKLNMPGKKRTYPEWLWLISLSGQAPEG